MTKIIYREKEIPIKRFVIFSYGYHDATGGLWDIEFSSDSIEETLEQIEKCACIYEGRQLHDIQLCDLNNGAKFVDVVKTAQQFNIIIPDNIEFHDL